MLADLRASQLIFPGSHYDRVHAVIAAENEPFLLIKAFSPIGEKIEPTILAGVSVHFR